MKQRKAQIAGIIVGVLFLFLVIAIVITGIIIANRPGTTTKPGELGLGEIQLFLKHSGNSSSEYIITNPSGGLLSTGKTVKDAYIPINLPYNESVNIYCWNENRYVEVTEKDFTQKEKEQNKTTVECHSTNIGKLEVTPIKAKIDRIDNTVLLNITPRGGDFRGLGMCFAWSAGVVYVKNLNDNIVCENGLWKNYTRYYVEDESYDYLPPGQYQCGLAKIEFCERVDGNRCYPAQPSKPYRYEMKVDECSYLGEDIKKDQSYTVRLEVKTLENKNSLDKVEIYFYDADLRYFPAVASFYDTPEDSFGDIGADDVVYTIKYEDTGNDFG